MKVTVEVIAPEGCPMNFTAGKTYAAMTEVPTETGLGLAVSDPTRQFITQDDFGDMRICRFKADDLLLGEDWIISES